MGTKYFGLGLDFAPTWVFVWSLGCANSYTLTHWYRQFCLSIHSFTRGMAARIMTGVLCQIFLVPRPLSPTVGNTDWILADLGGAAVITDLPTGTGFIVCFFANPGQWIRGTNSPATRWQMTCLSTSACRECHTWSSAARERWSRSRPCRQKIRRHSMVAHNLSSLRRVYGDLALRD